MKKVLLFLLIVVTAGACCRSVSIKGHLVGSDVQGPIYLEHVSPFGTRVADTVAQQDGKFSVKIKLPDNQPTFYNIHAGEHLIPLLLSPGERLKVNGFGNISRNYTVKGSEGSNKMRELVMTLNNGAASLDSLSNLFTALQPDDTMRNAVSRQYGKTYYGIKRDQIRFIVSNPGSLAAVYGLYQRLPNDNALFNGDETDAIYYRTVADSLAVTHPDSPYLRALLGDIERMAPHSDDDLVIQTVNYPDIEMRDIYGKQIKLSSLQGGVVLLDFWSALVPQCRLMNADLKEVYEDLHPLGFEVYQVSVDTSKPDWVNAVLDQKLPWASVSDLRGAASPAVRTYNVGSVPANFLLDRDGNLVGKDLYGQQLVDKVKSLL